MDFFEGMGDRPAWMRIKRYKAEGRRAELILSLRKRDYWFPVSPSVYSKFRAKIVESRSEGLRYLQKYIRSYKGYAGRWPSAEYVYRNRISETLLKESISSSAISLFDGGSSLAQISRSTNLPMELVEKLLRVAGKLDSVEEIHTDNVSR